MSTKLFLIALTAFLGISQFANAGVLLFVHFGDNAPLEVASRDQLVTSYVPNDAVDTITANIYMHLTNGSNLYHYRFSVRYDSSLLGFIAPSATEEFQFRPGDFEADTSIGTPIPVPFQASPVASQVQNGMDLHKFNGTMDTGSFNDDGFYKVATLSFKRLASLQTPARLIEPGKFELSPVDVNVLDAFLGVSALDPNDTDPVDLTTEGGSVAISSVPEPFSALAFGVLGILGLVRRRKSQAA